MKKKLTMTMCLAAGLLLASHSNTVKAVGIDGGGQEISGQTKASRSISGVEGKNIDYNVYYNIAGGFTQKFNIVEAIETEDSYVFTVERGFIPNGHSEHINSNMEFYVISEKEGKTFQASDIRGIGHAYFIVTFKKDKDLVGRPDARFKWTVTEPSLKTIYQCDLRLRFDTGIPLPPVETDQSVVLYQNTDGTEKLKFINDYPVDVSDCWDTTWIRSVKLPPGTSIILYRGKDYTGDLRTVTNTTDKPATYNVPDGVHEQFMSYKIVKNEVVLYDNADGADELAKYSEKFVNVAKMSNNDNKVSSVKLVPHTSITLYENANYTGKSQVITNDTDNFMTYNVCAELNDKVSSYDISEAIPVGKYNNKSLTIQNLKDTSNVVEWNTSHPDNVLVSKDKGGRNQLWQLSYDASDDTYQISSSIDGKKVYVTTDDDENILINASQGDKWRLIKVGDHANGNVVMFRNLKTGKVMDMPGSKSEKNLIVYPSYATENQKFVLKENDKYDVTLYANYGGDDALVMHNENYINVSKMPSDLNDKVSSVKLPAHTSITLYADTDFKGESKIITNSTDKSAIYDLGHFGDKTSSYEVSAEIPVGLYKNQTLMIQSASDTKNVLEWSESHPTDVLMLNNHGYKNQCWKLTYDASDDTYQILCDTGSKKAYLVADTATNESGNSYITTNATQGDKWRVVKVADHTNGNVVMLRNLKTGKVMDMPGGKSGERLILYPSHAGSTQRFVMSMPKANATEVVLYDNYADTDGELAKYPKGFNSVSSLDSKVNNKISYVSLPAHTSIILYADARFKGETEVITNDTDTAAIYEVSDALNDKVSSYDISDAISKGVYNNKVTSIQSYKDTGNVIDWSLNHPDNIITYHNNGDSNQKWAFIYDASDDTYRMMCGPITMNGKMSSAYLTVDPKTDDIVRIDKTADINTEKWRLIKIGTFDGGDGFMFRNVKTGKVLDIPGGKFEERLIAYTSRATMNQKWIVHVEGDVK